MSTLKTPRRAVYLSDSADIRIRLRTHLRELQSDSPIIEYSVWDRDLYLLPGSTKKFAKEVAVNYGYQVIEEGSTLLELGMETTVRYLAVVLNCPATNRHFYLYIEVSLMWPITVHRKSVCPFPRHLIGPHALQSDFEPKGQYPIGEANLVRLNKEAV